MKRKTIQNSMVKYFLFFSLFLFFFSCDKKKYVRFISEKGEKGSKVNVYPERHSSKERDHRLSWCGEEERKKERVEEGRKEGEWGENSTQSGWRVCRREKIPVCPTCSSLCPNTGVKYAFTAVLHEQIYS